MRTQPFIIATALVALLSCKAVKEKLSGGSPSASASAAVASAAPQPSASAATGNGLAAPERDWALPLKTGQFVRYRVTDKGQQSEFSYSVVGEEGGAHWLQVVTEKGGRRVVIQILLRLGERHTPKSAELLAVKMKMGSMVREFRGATLAAMKNRVSGAMKELNLPGLTGLPQEDVTVPAGTFKSCFVREATTTLLGMTTRTKNWIHTGVPVLAMVKAEAPNGDYVIELMEYGETGAKNEL
jgi:hypothetical protein